MGLYKKNLSYRGKSNTQWFGDRTIIKGVLANGREESIAPFPSPVRARLADFSCAIVTEGTHFSLVGLLDVLNTTKLIDTHRA